jgi:hypothetical protein
MQSRQRLMITLGCSRTKLVTYVTHVTDLLLHIVGKAAAQDSGLSE